MKVRLIDVSQHPLETLDEFASASYNTDVSKFKKVGKLLDVCTASGHTSVQESIWFVFHIEDVSRSLLAQFTRHRMAGYCVQSQRYVDQSKFQYITPKTISDNPEANHLYALHMANTREEYKTLVNDYRVPKEDARYLLPEATTTCINYSVDLRSLIEASHQRLCNRAQWEIRELFNSFKKIIYMTVDIPRYGEARISKYLVPKCETNLDCPFCTEHNSCGKHPKLKEIYQVYLNHKNDKKA